MISTPNVCVLQSVIVFLFSAFVYWFFSIAHTEWLVCWYEVYSSPWCLNMRLVFIERKWTSNAQIFENIRIKTIAEPYRLQINSSNKPSNRILRKKLDWKSPEKINENCIYWTLMMCWFYSSFSFFLCSINADELWLCGSFLLATYTNCNLQAQRISVLHVARIRWNCFHLSFVICSKMKILWRRQKNADRWM